MKAEQLKGSWTTTSFEIKGEKTFTDKWVEFDFETDGSVKFRYFSGGKFNSDDNARKVV